MQSIVGSELQKRENDLTDQWIKKLTNPGNLTRWSGAENSQVMSMLAQLNKAQGTNWGLDSNAVRGSANNRTFAFLDEQGKLVTRTAEQVASTIAAAEALKELSGSAEKASQILGNINNLSGPSSDAMKSFIANNDFRNLTKQQINSIDPQSDQMSKFFAENAESLGYKSGEDFKNAFIQAQKDTQKDWRIIGQQDLQPVKESLNNLFADNSFTLSASKNIQNTFNKAFKQIGQKGLDSFSEIFETAGEDADQLSEIFANADISTPQGLQALEESLKNVGDGTFVLSEQWQQLKKQIQDSQFVNPLDAIFDRQANVNSIAKNIKKYSVVNEDDYNALLEINPAISEMFARVAEGYQFIGKKGSLMELLTGGTNGYIQAAQQFDKIKGSATQLGNQFAENFQGSLVNGVDLSNLVEKTIGSIDGNEQLFSALGFNEDYLKASLQRYSELYQKDLQDINGLNEEEKAQFQGLQNELQGFLDKAADAPDVVQGITDSLRQAAALGAQSISELNDMLAQGKITGQMYGEALEKVSDTQMSNYGFDVDQYENYVDLLQASSKELEQNEYLARQLAKTQMRVSKGTQDLVDNWDDWNNLLLDFKDNGDLTTLASDWDDMRESFANLFNTDEESIDMLGPDFIAKNLDKIEQVKAGTEGAYEQLKVLMDQQLLIKAYGVSDFSALDQDIQDAYNKINEVSNDATIEVGAVFTGEDELLNSFQRIADGANWTSEEAQRAFSEMGYDVQVEGKDGQLKSDTEETQYYVPPTYHMVPHHFDMGPFGSGNMLIPEILEGGHYQSAGTGVKQSYQPGHYAIKTVTKKGGSNGGNISRNIAGGRSNAPKSSGGKKGGGGSAKKPTTVKAVTPTAKKQHVEDRSDPYHDINKALQKQKDQLDKIQKKDKKLVNKDRLKNIEDQNKAIQDQNKLLSTKADIAQGEKIRLRNELVADLGKAIQFNSDGSIANYNQALDAATANYNKAIDKRNNTVAKADNDLNAYIARYNKMSAAQQQKNKAQYEKVKEEHDAIIKKADQELKLEEEKRKRIQDNVKEYENTQDIIDDINKQTQQNLEKIYENNIQAFNLKVHLSIDSGQLERDWLDFEKKFIKKLDDGDFIGSAKASMKDLMSYFNSNQIQATADAIKRIQNEIAIMQAGGTSSIYGDNMAQAQQDLEEYMKQQMSDLEDIQGYVDDIKENYLDALDDAKDKMDDQIEQYERVNDLIDHNVKLVQMIYGDKAYNTMQKYYQMQKENNNNALDSLRQQQQYWQNLLNNEEVGTQSYNRIKENLDKVTDDLNSKLEDMIDKLANQWENRLNSIVANLNLSLTDGRGLDYLDEQWDYINNYDDQFLDTFESKMGIQEVQDLYQQAMDGLNGSPANQQKINKLMNQQLQMLREKDNLTQYDIDRAKASLEVEKARMALEDARYNKTKMRLRRDSQGNYTYQYVADEEKLSDLQSALNDAQANLYNMDKDHYKENLDTLYDTYKEYLEKRQALEEEYRQAQAAGDEQEMARIQKRIDLAAQQYTKIYDSLSEENKQALEYLGQSFADGMDIDKATMSAEQFADVMKENIPQVSSNIQDLINKIRETGGLAESTAEAMKKFREATTSYTNDVNATLEAGGTSVETVMNVVDEEGNPLDQNIQAAKDLITTNEELIASCEAQVQEMQKMLSWLDAYMNKVMDVQKLVANLRNAYNLDQNLYGSNLQADVIPVTDNNLDTTNGMNFTGNPATDAAAVKKQIDTLLAQYEKFLQEMSIATFDTGGATGSWGDASGRLAFLHEKELVLNQEDTANILAVVESVRSITSALNGVTNGEIASLVANATGLMGSLNTASQLDQNVHIEANFPNVTQHTEIEQAFENLVNMASMHASKYRD